MRMSGIRLLGGLRYADDFFHPDHPSKQFYDCLVAMSQGSQGSQGVEAILE